ncbi:MAG: F0F1 ATP synthase subunit epsilon [Candidatus Pacebacteria bacterium]|nr:F0F1 ATP synthase subunit epsilon [Candidatus Paceibacterota bacterium]MCF7857038.1 F0F1 ATP synthase subunit epsilon [Candidatus Paceibacterota bacterium]
MKQEAVFRLTISKINEQLFSGEANSITLPGTEGVLTILAHHESLVSLLKEGTIHVRTGEEITTFQISKGLLETSNNQVTVLV